MTDSSRGRVHRHAKASSPFAFHSRDIMDALEREKLLEGVPVPDYLYDFLATCTMAELRAFAEVYRCPDCGGKVHPTAVEGEAEGRSKPKGKG